MYLFVNTVLFFLVLKKWRPVHRSGSKRLCAEGKQKKPRWEPEAGRTDKGSTLPPPGGRSKKMSHVRKLESHLRSSMFTALLLPCPRQYFRNTPVSLSLHRLCKACGFPGRPGLRPSSSNPRNPKSLSLASPYPANVIRPTTVVGWMGPASASCHPRTASFTFCLAWKISNNEQKN